MSSGIRTSRPWCLGAYMGFCVIPRLCSAEQCKRHPYPVCVKAAALTCQHLKEFRFPQTLCGLLFFGAGHFFYKALRMFRFKVLIKCPRHSAPLLGGSTTTPLFCACRQSRCPDAHSAEWREVQNMRVSILGLLFPLRMDRSRQPCI